jgi:hypothetical protein
MLKWRLRWRTRSQSWEMGCFVKSASTKDSRRPRKWLVTALGLPLSQTPVAGELWTAFQTRPSKARRPPRQCLGVDKPCSHHNPENLPTCRNSDSKVLEWFVARDSTVEDRQRIWFTSWPALRFSLIQNPSAVCSREIVPTPSCYAAPRSRPFFMFACR